MLRTILLTVTLFAVLFAFGCQKEALKDDPRFHVDPAEAAFVTEQGFGVPEATEVDLVEKMAEQRNEYRASLADLLAYYKSTGNATKTAWAQRELTAMIQYKYLMPAEEVFANMSAVDSIPAADELYAEAMADYKDAGGMLIVTNNAKLRIALNKFNKLISNYSSSDKIDDTAYRAGRIYEHFRDYEIAAVYYQRAFQWDEETPYPARFRAAYVMDQYLRMRTEALTVYQLAIQYESRYEGNTEYAKERILKITRPKPQTQE